MLRIGLCATTLFLAAGATLANNWRVVHEVSATEKNGQCILQSIPIEGLAIHYDGDFSIYSEHMLDDTTEEMGMQIDRLEFIAAKRNHTLPHIAYLKLGDKDTKITNKKLLSYFIRGRNAKLKVETILNGSLNVDITLIGFTIAYENYLACKKASRR